MNNGKHFNIKKVRVDMNVKVESLEPNASEEGGNDLQYLTFILDNEEYGLPILSVMEIRGWEEPTRVPDCPVHVKGVINIRGIVVPIIDLREKFSMPKKEYTPFTVTIVVQIEDEKNEKRVVGFVVDGVSEVYNFKPEQLKEVPQETTIEKKYIENLSVIDDQIIILLNPENMLEEYREHL